MDKAKKIFDEKKSCMLKLSDYNIKDLRGKNNDRPRVSYTRTVHQESSHKVTGKNNYSLPLSDLSSTTRSVLCEVIHKE